MSTIHPYTCVCSGFTVRRQTGARARPHFKHVPVRAAPPLWVLLEFTHGFPPSSLLTRLCPLNAFLTTNVSHYLLWSTWLDE